MATSTLEWTIDGGTSWITTGAYADNDGDNDDTEGMDQQRRVWSCTTPDSVAIPATTPGEAQPGQVPLCFAQATSTLEWTADAWETTRSGTDTPAYADNDGDSDDTIGNDQQRLRWGCANGLPGAVTTPGGTVPADRPGCYVNAKGLSAWAGEGGENAGWSSVINHQAICGSSRSGVCG